MKKKLLFVYGTRPEVIKVAPVIKEAQKEFNVVCVSTGQHRQMIDPLLKGFEIKSDYDLNIMKPSQTLNDISLASISGLDEIFKKENPDLVLVQGDTTTAAMASLTAFNLKLKVAHIEAGLRTFDRFSPWPEEFNRRLISLGATLHFTPTESSKQNLLKEGINSNEIFVTGNTSIDSLLLSAKLPESQIGLKYANHLNGKKLVLATLHRRENFGEPLKELFVGIRELLNTSDIQVVLPLHMNPQVRKVANEIFDVPLQFENAIVKGGLVLTPPLDYFEFIYFMKKARLIVTDSGGVQEEAPCLGKPILIARESTERQETVEAGQGLLIGHSKQLLLEKCLELLDDSELYKSMAQVRYIFGDGTSSEKIIKSIKANFK